MSGSTVESELAEMGFELTQRRRDGVRQYVRRTNPYLAYWLTVGAGGEAELGWEFSLGQYLRDRGLAVSGQDELSLLMFPGKETRGTLEPGWPSKSVADVETLLGSLDFVAGR
jgi:hypothetical protein